MNGEIKDILHQYESIFGLDVGRVVRVLATCSFRDSEKLTSVHQERLLRTASKPGAHTMEVEHLKKLFYFGYNSGLDYLWTRTRLDLNVISLAARLG